MRILVVEDSARMQRALVDGLKHGGYAVDAVSDGEEGLWRILQGVYDAVVLDVRLPKMDGLTVLQKVRRAGNKTLILLLTVNQSIDDRVTGLRMGADDYIPKPFAMSELLARSEALVRRAHGQDSSVVSIRNLTMDLSARIARVDEQVLKLTAREYRMLEYFVLNQGRVLSRAQIEEHVYDEESGTLMSNAVDSAISSLRKKLGQAGASKLIDTRRGLGYVLQAP